MSIQCRTCAVKILNPNAKNLFKQESNEILLNIETLTGIRLNEDEHMPKHICTCCHLDLYHSIAFRERCLKTENLLQTANTKTLDPLNTPQSQYPIGRLENLIINTSDSEILREHFSQRRVLRVRQQKMFPSAEKCRNANEKKCSYNRNVAKTSLINVTQPDSKDAQYPEVQTTSPLPTQSKCERNSSILVTKDDEFNTFDETEDFQQSAGKKMSPIASLDASQSPSAKDNNMTYNNSKKDRAEVKLNTGAKVFICDLCGHQSSNPKNLDIHILRHKGEKNFECDECGTKHYSKYLLQLHIRVKHKGEMPFVCRYCDQRFYSGSTRQRHEQVRHVRSWSYVCKICGKKYNTKSCLNKHEFLHSGLRPYRCDLCNVAFPRKPGLNIHCRTKQHLKRASESLNRVKDITVPDDTIGFPDSIIVQLDV